MVALDFPDAPTNGQVFDKWTWNGTQWVLTAGVLANTWVAWTPVNGTGGTVGAGVAKGRYYRVGAHTVHAMISWTYGAGAFGGSGLVTFSLPTGLPLVADWPSPVLGVAHLFWSTGRSDVCVVRAATTTTVSIWGTFGQMSTTSPQGPAVNDSYNLTFTYEC